ncbi:unnamed protein product [Rhizophagus irregularis]|nr:unnamed protein product [Rhizophagus irregularis]
MDEIPKKFMEEYDEDKYQDHVTIPTIDSAIESENVDDRVVYIGDLEKRKQAYGICGECKNLAQDIIGANLVMLKDLKITLKIGLVEIKILMNLIQQSQLNAIYSAEWPEGFIYNWDIENQKWNRWNDVKYALKSLNNSSDICSDFLNEIKSHLQIHLVDIVQCFGITQDQNNKEGLLDIHNAEKVHKDFHSGNILFKNVPYISDLGMCQPANIKQTVGIYGVLPYMAPEVLRGQQYTKAADIYSFGIIMNEFLSEEIPFNDIPS